MKPNKALQGTQPVQSTSNSLPTQISPQSGECGENKRDNPNPTSLNIKAVERLYRQRLEVGYKYKIAPQAIDLLVMIGSRWNEGQPSTLYSLSVNRNKGNIHALWVKANRLQSKGFIEVIGTSASGKAFVYAPSLLGKQILSDICAIGSN